LKQINEEQKEGLLEELRVVNLSKFVSEAVTAILDAKLRSSDINAAVQVRVLILAARVAVSIVVDGRIQNYCKSTSRLVGLYSDGP
jgi:hypothetical protein